MVAIVEKVSIGSGIATKHTMERSGLHLRVRSIDDIEVGVRVLSAAQRHTGRSRDNEP